MTRAVVRNLLGYAVIVIAMLTLSTNEARADREIDLVCHHGTCCAKKPRTTSGTAGTIKVGVKVTGHAGKEIFIVPRNSTCGKTNGTCPGTSVLSRQTCAADDACSLEFKVAEELEDAFKFKVVVGDQKWTDRDACRDADTIDWDAASRAGVLPQVSREQGFEPTSIDTAVTQLLTVVAEIAVDKARSKAAQVLMTQVRNALCERRVPDVLALGTPDTDGKVPLEHYLRTTCALLRSMRFADLATSGKSALNALQHDGLGLLEGFVDAKLEGKQPFADLVGAMFGTLDRAIDDPDNISTSVPMQLLSHILATDWTELAKAAFEAAEDALNRKLAAEADEAAKSTLEAEIAALPMTWAKTDPAMCVAAAAATVVRACYVDSAVTCDAPALVANLKKHVPATLAVCVPALADKYKQITEIADLGAQLLAELSGVAIGPNGSSAKQRSAKQLVKIAVDMYTALIQSHVAADPELAQRVTLARELIRAALNKDMPAVISTTSQLILVLIDKDNGEAVRKAAAFLNTVVVYVEASKEEDLDKAKELRRKAVETLVDEVTDRRNRHGDRVFSLGVNVGTLGIGFEKQDGDYEEIFAQPALPFGFAYQRLPGKDTPIGVHGMLFLFDLGQFVAFDADEDLNDPRWDTAFTIGGQLGLILGRPDVPVTVGLEARYSPSLFERGTGDDTKRGAVRIGVFLEYYVPFFDFN